MSRIGPKLVVTALCVGCEHYRQSRDRCEALSEVRLTIGVTPQWCPVMTDEQRAALGWEKQ